MPRRRRTGSYASDATGLQQSIQNFGESFAEGSIFERRRRAQSERAQEAEQVQSLIRQRGLQEALSLLSMGNKQGAADVLTRLGIDVPTRDVTTRELAHEPVPGEDIEAQAFIPRVERTRRDIALETPQEKFEREQGAQEGRESRGRRETFELGQQGAEAQEQRVRDRPPQTMDEVQARVFEKIRRGDRLTPGEQQLVQDFMEIRQNKVGFEPRLKQRIIDKLDAGEALLPHEQQFADAQLFRAPGQPNPAAERRAEERLDISRQQLDVSREGQRASGARATESQASNERNRVFDDIDRARQVVEKKYARQRESVSLSPNRQQDLARIDAAEDAELSQVTERMKKRFPKYGPDIDAQFGGGGGSGRPAPRPSILDLFNQGPTRGTPRG